MPGENEAMNYIPVFSLIISFIALGVAIISYCKTKMFQDYEFAPRLQIVDEEFCQGTPSLVDRPAFSYQAKITNRGSKTVKIDSLYLDYGDRSDKNKRMKCHIGGETFLSPKQSHPFSSTISWNDVEKMKKKFNINQYYSYIRIAYYTANNDLQETTRALSGFDGSTIIFTAQKGDCIS